MCGIVSERIIKDMLRLTLYVRKGVDVVQPSSKAFDQLERVEISGLMRFAKDSEVINEESFKAADKLSQIRNDYTHARGKNSEKDALKAIELLHVIIDDTVSAHKDYVIEDGTIRTRMP